MNFDDLLAKANNEFESFSLVWRDEFEFNENCDSIELSLKSYLLKEERTDEWPGTKIFNALATVRHYKVEIGSIEILKKVGSFGAWLAPSYPEDLAFYKGVTVVYSSIAHENDEWLEPLN